MATVQTLPSQGAEAPPPMLVTSPRPQASHARCTGGLGVSSAPRLAAVLNHVGPIWDLYALTRARLLGSLAEEAGAPR